MIFLSNEDKYNRVFGIDYRLASKDNTWVGKYFIHKSFSPKVTSKDFSWGASTEYNSKNWEAQISGTYVGDNYRSDLGFIRRTDVFHLFNKLERRFWPKRGTLQRHSISFFPIFTMRPGLDLEVSDRTLGVEYEAEFQNTSRFSFEVFNRFTYLYEEFDPTRTDDAVPLPIGGYTYTEVKANYNTDRRKNLTFRIEPSYGEFYNGSKLSVESRLSWRLQPYFTTSIDVNYDSINLPDPYPDASIWLLGPRFDITFNKSVFWATFIQYSTQRDNFSVNTRLQWRFAPLSDLFVVYNDNYFVDSVFAPRVRSLNFKLTYWLNI